MAISELHAFSGRGVVSKVVFVIAGEPRRTAPSGFELTNVRSLADIGQGVSNVANWIITRLDVSCDFSMKRHDDEIFGRVHARFARGMQPAGPNSGVHRTVEVLNAGSKILRTTIELTDSKVPGQLQGLDGWRQFRFESVRTAFQFRAPGAATVDEELHERLRHALRNLTRHFQGGQPK